MNAPDPEVRDAVLEAALEQELGGERPPDLTDRVLAAARQRDRSRWSAARSHLSIAALVLLSLGLLIAVWAWPGGAGDDRHAQSDDVTGPRPWHQDLIVPSSPAEAVRLIGEASAVDARVFAVRDPVGGQWVRIESSPFENLLAPLFANEKPLPRVQAEGDQQADWSASVRRVVVGPGRTAPRDATCPLELLFRIGERGTLVVGIDDSHDPVTLCVRGLPTAWTLPFASALPGELRRLLDEPLRAAIEARGIAIQRDGLDRLPTSATRIRAVSLDAADVTALVRFPNLTSLDLSRSPAAVTPVGLEGLARCAKLRSLVLPALGIGAGHLAPVVALPGLQELFVGAPDWALFARPAMAVVNRVDDHCAELLTRATRLRELWLPATNITDAGLAKLAGLPLWTLTVGSPNLTGTGFSVFRDSPGLRELALTSCDGLTVAGFRSLADAVRGPGGRAPASLTLCDCPVPEPGIAALLDAGALQKLTLVRCRPLAGWPRLLGSIARAPELERLTLSVGDDFRIDDLGQLGGATALRKVEVALPPEHRLPDVALERVRAALPGVSLDVFRVPL